MSKFKFSQIPLSVRMIVAMALGLIIGGVGTSLFSTVNHLANAFVMLLQMTALPYISLSLMVGIGSLSAHKAKNALKSSLLWLLVLIALMLCFILLAPVSYTHLTLPTIYSV